MKLFLGSLVLLLLAGGIAFWLTHSARKTEGGSLCLLCGRREWDVFRGERLISTKVEDDGSEFLQRFGAAVPPNHEHDWEPDGCIFEGNTAIRVRSCGRAWIRILPRFSDRASADALFREAIALTPERRRELIASFEGAFGGSEGAIDEAFARWNEKRHSR